MYSHFERSYWLHTQLQSKKTPQPTLLGVTDAEDEGATILRNVGGYQTTRRDVANDEPSATPL